jgi:hypothetical protein
LRRPRLVVGQDHLAHGGDAVALEEHVLGAAQADALGAELAGPLGASAGVSALVRTLSVRYLSAHFMTLAKSPESFGSMVATLPDHFAGRAVDESESPSWVKVLPPTVILRAFLVDLIAPAPATQQRAPAAGDDRRVAGHAAGAGENAHGLCMPSMSSGLVSLRTRMTFSPLRASARPPLRR